MRWSWFRIAIRRNEKIGNEMINNRIDRIEQINLTNKKLTKQKLTKKPERSFPSFDLISISNTLFSIPFPFKWMVVLFEDLQSATCPFVSCVDTILVSNLSNNNETSNSQRRIESKSGSYRNGSDYINALKAWEGFKTKCLIKIKRTRISSNRRRNNIATNTWIWRWRKILWQ